MAKEFRVTGKHVLYTLIGFFLVVVAANVVLMNFALKTFPGETEEKSYLQGLNYNDRLDARAEQAKLGWTASISEASLARQTASIRVTMRNRLGAPLSNLRIVGVLSRPAVDQHDNEIVFKPLGPGEYAGVVSAGDGQWDLDGVATDQKGNQFEFATRLTLE
ncbi:MAG: FixH family protein [Parvularculaceae bacterium]